MRFEWPEFRRCCICLPLRKGVLVFSYINAVLCILMLLMIFCMEVPAMSSSKLFSKIPEELSAFLYCVDFVATVMLIYGIHKKIILIVKIYFYFMISTMLSSVFLQIIELSLLEYTFMKVESTLFFITSLSFNLYLLFLVRSLLKKMEISDSHAFGNQLHDVVSEEPKVEVNADTVVPNRIQ